jgi:hypothetical protein
MLCFVADLLVFCYGIFVYLQPLHRDYAEELVSRGYAESFEEAIHTFEDDS